MAAPGVRLLGRFDIESKVGEGGMGQVFRAFDGDRKAHVALKILGELSPRSIAQIKREFRTAAELVHPNLVRLHELFCDGPEWFFTMDLIHGVTLPTLLERTPRPHAELLRRVIRQVASALMALHRAGAIHGDLKPSNFLIAGPDHHVHLLDFGLARPLGPIQDRDFAGTPAYMAPEQIMGDVLTEAADWYALGVVLYEALTGELPRRRPSPARLDGVDEDLRRLCLELLALDPNDRPTGDQVLARTGVVPVEEAWSLAPPASRFPLVGRQSELARLEAAYNWTLEDGGSIALVYGPSGIGKTALVERFVLEAEARGAVVLRGRCRERESMGYKAVDGLIDDLVALLSDMDPAVATSLLPEDTADLTTLFPALLGADVVSRAAGAPVETPDQGLVRERAIAAFCELLARLRARAPLVLWIDDLQWSDAESALLIGRLVGGQRPVPVLLVASYRGETRGPLLDALLGDATYALPPATDISLGPLEPGDAERLALALISSEDPAAQTLAHTIVRDAAGHPLFIAELAHAAARGALDPPADRMTLSDLIVARVAALDPTARGVLEIAAVAGVPLSRAVLRRARGLSPTDVEAALDLLRANRLARSHGLRARDSVDIHHDRIREILVQGLGVDRRRQAHLSIAQALDAEAESRHELLALHYEAGGDPARAGACWIEGADQARKALAFGHAADLYAKGASLARLSPAALHAVRLRRAEALAFAGKGVDAANQYLSAAPGAAPREALELRRRAAEQLLLSGHVEQGLAVIEEVLRAVGMRRTRSGRRALAAILVGRVIVRARGLRHSPRSERDIPTEELARVDASWTIARSLLMVDFVRGADFQNRHLLLALEAGEPSRILRALALEASFAVTPGAGNERRSARLLTVAEELARRSGDENAATLLCLTRGIATYCQGSIDAALAHCEEALSLLAARRAGPVWEAVTAQRFVIASLFFLGRLGRLAAFVPPLLAEAEGTGNVYAMMCFRAAYSTPGWLVSGNVDEAARQLDRTREQWKDVGFQIPHYNLLVGDTFLDFYRGDGERALARLRQQWPGIVDAQLLRIGAMRVQLWQLLAGSACMAAQAALARGQRARAGALRAEARQLARRLHGEPIQRSAPLAELLLAALDREEHEEERARGHLRNATRLFRQQGLPLFAAAAQVGLGELTRGPAGEELVRSGLLPLEREGVVSPLRMVALLAPGFGGGAT
jgi:hypothetical protein